MFKISLEALNLLDAIDRHGSFAGAAKELFRVPSAVSYTVQKLEENLDVKLFVRNGPKISLTRAGAELLKEGRVLMQAAAELENRVQRVASGWETELRIGVNTMFSSLCLKDDLQAFHQETSQTGIRISEEVLSGTWESLQDGRTDIFIGVTIDNISLSGEYHTHLIGQMPFSFVVSPSHPLAQMDRPLTQADLLAHHAIVVSDSARRLPARTVGVLSGQSSITVPNLLSKFEYQMAGLGFGFLPAPYVEEAVRQRLLVEKEVSIPKPIETLYVAWRNESPGKALAWWQKRLARPDLFERMVAFTRMQLYKRPQLLQIV